MVTAATIYLSLLGHAGPEAQVALALARQQNLQTPAAWPLTAIDGVHSDLSLGTISFMKWRSRSNRPVAPVLDALADQGYSRWPRFVYRLSQAPGNAIAGLRHRNQSRGGYRLGHLQLYAEVHWQT